MRGCVRIAWVIFVERVGQKSAQWPLRLRCNVEIEGDLSWWGHAVMSKRLGSFADGRLTPESAVAASKTWRMSASLRRWGRCSTSVASTAASGSAST